MENFTSSLLSVVDDDKLIKVKTLMNVYYKNKFINLLALVLFIKKYHLPRSCITSPLFEVSYWLYIFVCKCIIQNSSSVLVYF